MTKWSTWHSQHHTATDADNSRGWVWFDPTLIWIRQDRSLLRLNCSQVILICGSLTGAHLDQKQALVWLQTPNCPMMCVRENVCLVMDWRSWCTPSSLGFRPFLLPMRKWSCSWKNMCVCVYQVCYIEIRSLHRKLTVRLDKSRGTGRQRDKVFVFTASAEQWGRCCRIYIWSSVSKHHHNHRKKKLA